VPPRGSEAVPRPSFLSQDTIAFFSLANPVIDGNEQNPQNDRRTFSVKTSDPETLRIVPVFAEASDGPAIIEAFQITGPEPRGRTIDVNGIKQAFVLDGERILQLTNFGASATNVSADGQRIFFHSSADPLGTNPCYDSNLFSMDRNGGDLRQLTGRSEGEPSKRGYDQPRDCAIVTGGINPDSVTRSLAFASQCDLVGRNPDGGHQIFAIHPDGTGLRQLTQARGGFREPDGTVTVENVGPWNSSTLPR